MNVREDRRVAFGGCWSFVVAWRTAEGRIMMRSGYTVLSVGAAAELHLWHFSRQPEQSGRYYYDLKCILHFHRLVNCHTSRAKIMPTSIIHMHVLARCVFNYFYAKASSRKELSVRAYKQLLSVLC